MSSEIAALEYLATTRIGEKGQLTVPKEFRRELGLSAGAPFAVLRMGDGLILLPEQKRFEQLCEQVSSKLTRAGITAKTVLATLPGIRQRLYERRYRAKTAKSASRRSHRKK
ncbi:MAG: AbrB/MazE/SpoVT family DNA-binding domain-containing protein [Acidobacteriia bacterium]|nr:AbrB/MazE/SpoVT family DNA-binding domain-containing protein [Terriglobia bacterium]